MKPPTPAKITWPINEVGGGDNSFALDVTWKEHDGCISLGKEMISKYQLQSLIDVLAYIKQLEFDTQ